MNKTHFNTEFIKAETMYRANTIGFPKRLVPQADLQRWLREEKGITLFVEPYVDGYKWRLYFKGMSDGEHGYTTFKTWEECLEDGLKWSCKYLYVVSALP